MAHLVGGRATPFSLAQTINTNQLPPSTTATGPAPSAPQYGDIFNYLDPNTEGAKNTWAKGTQNQTITGYAGQDEQGNQIPTYGMDYNNLNQGLPDKYKGLVSGLYSTGGPGLQANYDFSKIGGGGTVFGNDKNHTIDQMYSLGTDPTKPPTLYMPSQGGRKQDDMYVTDRKQVKWDPKFGWITPKQNLGHPPEDKSWLDYVGMAGQAAAGAMVPGFGLGMGLIQGVGTGIDTHNWGQVAKSVAPSLIGAGIGMLPGMPSLPAGLQQAMNIGRMGYGAYNAFRSRDPYQIAMTLARGIPFGR